MARYFIILLVFIGIQSRIEAQTDKELLLSENFEDHSFDDRIVHYGFRENNRSFNPLYHALSSAMFVYQKIISPQLSKQCAFLPTCSAYSKELINTYGMFKGVFCTADRLMRCNRIALSDKPSYYFENKEHKIHEDADYYRLNSKMQ
jgi:Uncharacterized conserved protein